MGGQAEGDAPPPGCQAARFKSRIKANTDPVDGRADVIMGKDIFFSVVIRTTLTLKLRKPGAFRLQCEG